MTRAGDRRSSAAAGASRAAVALAVVVLLVLIAAVAWLATSRADDPPQALDPSALRSKDTTAEPLSLAVDPSPATPLVPELPGPEAETAAAEPPPITTVLSGVVRTASGEPVVGARVATVGWPRDGTDHATTTATDGTWTLGLPERALPIAVEASHAGHAAERRRVIWSGGSEDDGSWPTQAAPMEHRLRPLAHITGRLLWDDESPCAEARLSVGRESIWPTAAMLDTDSAQVVTDVDGRFEVRMARQQVVDIVVDDVEVEVPKLMREVTDEPEQEWTLVLPRPVSLTVSVDPGPVAPDLLEGAQVRLFVAAGTDGPRPVVQPLLAGEARFDGLDPRFPRAVRLEVRAHLPELLAYAVELPGRDNEVWFLLSELRPRTPRRVVRPTARTWTLPWRIVDAQGEVLSGSSFYGRLPITGGPLGYAMAESLASRERQIVAVDLGDSSRGWLGLHVEPPVRVELVLAGQHSVHEGLAPGDEVVVTLSDAADVYALVLRPVDAWGRLAAVATVEIVGEDRANRRVVPAHRDGTFPVSLGRGMYTVALSPLGGEPASVHTLHVPPARPDEPIDLLVHSAGALRGHAYAHWQGGLEVVARLVRARGPAEVAPMQEAAVGTSGAFDFPALTPGLYELTLWLRDREGVLHLGARTSVEVAAGQVTEAHLRHDQDDPRYEGRTVGLDATALGRGHRWALVTGQRGSFRWRLDHPPERRRLPVGDYRVSYSVALAGTEFRELRTQDFTVEPADDGDDELIVVLE